MHIGIFRDVFTYPFFYGLPDDECVDKDLSVLAQSVRPVDGLPIQSRIQRRLHQKDVIRRSQSDADCSGPDRQHKHLHRVIIRKLSQLFLPFVHRHRARKSAMIKSVAIQFAADPLQRVTERREYQRFLIGPLSPNPLQLGDESIELRVEPDALGLLRTLTLCALALPLGADHIASSSRPLQLRDCSLCSAERALALCPKISDDALSAENVAAFGLKRGIERTLKTASDRTFTLNVAKRLILRHREQLLFRYRCSGIGSHHRPDSERTLLGIGQILVDFLCAAFVS